MDTYFAPAEKTSEKDLKVEIDFVSNNPVVSGVLHSVGGLLAVLDENRQILAINDSFLKMLGIDNPKEVLGLRPGEAINCIHAEEGPGGCGTTKYCSSCGAAIAIVSSIEQDKPIERMCSLTREKGKNKEDLAFLVRSNPVRIENKRFLLIFLQDITKEQQRAALERTFFHDINNMLTMLLGSSELLLLKAPCELSEAVHQASLLLINEISIQRCLTESNPSEYKPEKDDYTVLEIFDKLKSLFQNHPQAREKIIEYQNNYPEVLINTDRSLCLRVLSNMMINALEATEKKEKVKIWVDVDDNYLTFFVWNKEEIPEKIANRIFQRNFSTKNDTGRGIGTFSMKLFGEETLGGKVDFTTSRNEGTTFRFRCPL